MTFKASLAFPLQLNSTSIIPLWGGARLCIISRGTFALCKAEEKLSGYFCEELGFYSRSNNHRDLFWLTFGLAPWGGFITLLYLQVFSLKFSSKSVRPGLVWTSLKLLKDILWIYITFYLYFIRNIHTEGQNHFYIRVLSKKQWKKGFHVCTVSTDECQSRYFYRCRSNSVSSTEYRFMKNEMVPCFDT